MEYYSATKGNRLLTHAVIWKCERKIKVELVLPRELLKMELRGQ